MLTLLEAGVLLVMVILGWALAGVLLFRTADWIYARRIEVTEPLVSQLAQLDALLADNETDDSLRRRRDAVAWKLEEGDHS